MKKIIILSLLFVVQQHLLANESAIFIEINEFANFKEIQQLSAGDAVNRVKSQFGSKYSVKFLNSKMDGTPLFPTSANIKKVLSEKNKKKLIFIHSHLMIDNKEALIVCADSKTGTSSSFIKNVDFTTDQAITIIQTGDINPEKKEAFRKSFSNVNGFVILLGKPHELTDIIKIYASPTDSWKDSLLEYSRKNDLTLSGKSSFISNKEIDKEKKNCLQAKKEAEQAESPKLSPSLYSSATMKMQLLTKNSPNDKNQAYFAWKDTVQSFYQSKADSLLKSLDEKSRELKYDVLKNYSHPKWKQLVSSIEKSKKLYEEKQYKESADQTTESISLLRNIYQDVTQNLLELIKQSDNKNSQGLIQSLVSLEPFYKLKYAFAGQKYINEAGIEFVFIPPGKFIMGSPATEAGHEGDEKQHEVNITKGFYLSVSEISENQWRQVMGLNYQSEQKVSSESESNSLGSQFPQRVSWREAHKYCQVLSSNSKLTYRLPTEAEWEYAARAGSNEAFSSGSILKPEEAVTKESRKAAQPAECKSTKANAWGLYDMHGNLWEWCSDWSFIYENKAVSDPQGPSEEFARENELDMKVVRGGSYDDPALKARSANRWEYSPSVTSKIIGFRIVLELNNKDKK
ncbi:MAG: formylglycine-generating enzyme family protein [Lentisphaeraceae bacterium]|nr:formylglycine-generating enzyme family protein [Lentisphaeraceae bacterium]